MSVYVDIIEVNLSNLCCEDKVIILIVFLNVM